MDEWAGGPTPGAPPRPRTPAELDAVAAEQRGLVTRRQCVDAGLTRKAIESRLRDRWVRVHPGVYQTRPGRDDWWTGALGAHLACGPRAAWARHTAAYRWGLVASPPRVVELMVPEGYLVSAPSGCVVSRCRHLDERVDPLRWPWLTTVDETVLDLAESGALDHTLSVVGRAFQRRLTDEDSLLRRLAARQRHPHRALLEEMLGDVAAGAESAMEVRYLRDVERAHGLPRGERQVVTGAGRRARHDVGYRAQRVLVELDGRLGHEERGDRVHDGVRDRRSASRGWLTVRAFWTDVAGQPCDLALDVTGVLQSRGWTGEPRPCRRRDCTVRGADRRQQGG
jgi:very-short-patch-repair endonuclease